MSNSLKGIKFLDEHPECRANDLKEAFTNKNIKGIFCAIGGFDTIKLTKFLFEDNHFVNIVKENPKIFLGFSDSTITILCLTKLV
ncbi:LD-carboxypeptidase [Chlamydia abortus]|nr:LD-carboxypeptidase [Chlamydia abortus]